jgi:hypothetical protein
MDYLSWVASKLRRHEQLRASLPLAEQDAAPVAGEIARLLAATLRDAPITDFLREWDANVRPAPHIHLPSAPYDQFSPITDDSHIRLASLNRLSLGAHGEDFEFAAAGRLWSVPKSLEPAFARLHNARAFSVADLAAALSGPSAKADLVKSLTVLARAGVVLVEKTG